ncbi:ankyrin repeat domain-containing protein [Pseudarthrobacter sp. CC4]|uniref:ankyrin repeat domain-containing protein n=1 Tax=Pseudarthrobacter TaxID=1742993 RepID=UPI002AA6ED52|nr:ankyrin repeat domain-containing protein [Pseudarthrobacter oxydans]WPU09950.1 ankyrin repeat domain-containing protein [Pseudarthrobacter oxydans]HET7783683.1 ankyrin repeat domain-containing protein [Arthrobacter sp.]
MMPVLRSGALGLVLSLALSMTACQAGPKEARPPQAAPPSSPGSTKGGPPATAPAAPPPPALSAGEQAQLDQDLVTAAKANDVPLVRELIRRGGNVNAKDALQDSAFLYAGAEGFNEVLGLTLAAGADVASTNRYGGTALIPASEHGHVDTVRILIDAGVPVNHVNNLGWTAMQEAILLNSGGPRQQEVVRLLLAAGADPEIRDPEGRTALQNAERLGFTEIANLLRHRG